MKPTQLSFLGAVILMLTPPLILQAQTPIQTATQTAIQTAIQTRPQPIATPLWPADALLAQGTAEADIPTLTAYLPAANPTGTAVILAPGGGYQHLSLEKEGSDVAHWMKDHGVAAFVLKYRLGPRYRHPVELGDAQRALRTVRAQAAQLGFRADRIGIMGFSAGGHLAATAGTLYDAGLPTGDAIDRVSSRPDFLILAYPVITMTEPSVHKGSRNALLGDKPDPTLLDLLSAEKHVDQHTPPTFLFATTDDATVPVTNSILFYQALVSAGVPAEMHLYAHGPHGAGLARGMPQLASWPQLLAQWMQSRGYMADDMEKK